MSFGNEDCASNGSGFRTSDTSASPSMPRIASISWWRAAQRSYVELKAVERLLPIHEAQLITHLKLSGCRLGLLINFNVEMLREGIRRRVNDFPDDALCASSAPSAPPR